MQNTEYVIMLKDDLKKYPLQWPVTISASSLDEIEHIDQFDPYKNPDLRWRSEYGTQYIKDKSLTNSQTGQEEEAEIHKMTKLV